MRCSRLFFALLWFFLFSITSASAQLGFDLDIKKPEPYDNRELRAERTSQKKFTLTRRIYQGTTTHYNYFFNANNRLNEVLNRAKADHKDDYTTLLPFYNYSLEATTANKNELDSVIYKAKAGIVLHDLRNDWIDDLYLLWGTAYYLQQEFDSAYQMFQFINYAFAEKEKDGYYKYIGSNMDGSNAQRIVSKEDDGFLKRMISDPPSRNQAFIWQIRTLIQAGYMAEAGSLIAALRTDPLFPVRLNAALHEVHALWFYQQAMWDSAAAHLIEALPQAKNRGEQARWEYLIAQLQERSNKREEAQQWFQKAIAHTTDPVMDIYARLNLIRLNKSGGDQYIDQNIAALVNMARKDKYEDYRDAIYFMAARMELERNNFDAASAYLLKGARYKSENANSGNSAYLQLADLSFAQKNYKQAASFYDSVRIENMPTEDAQRITERKAVLAKIVGPIHTVERQDSLQRIAALPEKERTDIIRKTVRQLRRQQGLKEEETTVIPISGPQRTTDENDLFSNTSSKGEWYFYNKTTRTSGAAAFQQVWGKRPNVDNWRRLSDVTAQLRNNANNTVNNTRGNPTLLPEAGPAIPTFDALLANLPLTAEQLQVSNDSIRTALYTLGSLYIDELEDYPSAITVFEELRRRFPQMDKEDEVLFHLYYGYNKLGNTAQAATIRNALTTKYPTSRYATILNTGKDPALDKPSTEVTKAYEEIYDLFIEGHFSEALIAKQQADSIYKTNYWSPQLLYIESVYFIQQRQDSTATALLTTLIQQNSGTPMAEKATRLKDVLSRRKEIEDELTRLQIERPEEEAVVKVPDVISPPAPKPVEPEKKEEPKKEEPKKEEPKKEEPKNEVVIKTEEPPKQKGDTTIRVQTKAPTIAKPDAKAVNDTIAKRQIVPKQSALYNYIAETPHLAVVVLNKVDVVYGNEARNAFNRYNREKYNTQPLNIQLTDFDTENKFLLIGDFINAQAAADYVLKAKAVAGTEIFPWLKAEKYSFLIITPQNLEVLKANPDLNKYRTFIEAAAGVKF